MRAIASAADDNKVVLCLIRHCIFYTHRDILAVSCMQFLVHNQVIFQSDVVPLCPATTRITTTIQQTHVLRD